MKPINKVTHIKNINLLFLFKTGVGSALAILLANKLGLTYSASAGIITLLTIQNTKKETIFIAFRRIIAFVVAVIIAYLAFSSFGYTSIAFGGFVFLFVASCHMLGLEDGISMNAVLTTHFLIEKRMDIPFLINEVSILLIGMSIGIGLNLIMPKNKGKMLRKQKQLEEQMKTALKDMACILKEKEIDCISQEGCLNFNELDEFLESLLKEVYEDAGNRLLTDTKYLLSYLEMRKLQITVLKNIMAHIKQIHSVVSQAYMISEYMERVSDSFHELNDVKALLHELEALNEFFRNEKLPISRGEFENRAILFLILKDLEYFLVLKREFVLESIQKVSLKPF